MAKRIFLLSPARCGGKRADLLYNPNARFEMAIKLRTPRGATLGETFSFLSGLYFRGKLAYARAFADAPRALHPAYVITTNRGLVPPDQLVTIDDLRAMGCTDIHHEDEQYHGPLRRDLDEIAKRAGSKCDFVLLGSIATRKYVDILRDVLGPRLKFPAEFVGRGDMSRGGLMLRCIDSRSELTYVPIDGATRHGARPPKLHARTSGASTKLTATIPRTAPPSRASSAST